MKKTPRRLSIQKKLNILVIGSILAVAAGLMCISYYFFCQRVDDKYDQQLLNAAEACAENVDPGMLAYFWNSIHTDEFQEMREGALEAGDQEIIKAWLQSRPGWLEVSYFGTDPEDADMLENDPSAWSLLDDYQTLCEGLKAMKDYLDVDAAYYQYDLDGVSYNIADPDEDLFYIGTGEEPIKEFSGYADNAAVSPTVYRSTFGWLCTAIEPVRDPATGKTVGVAGVDINMTEIVGARYEFLQQSILFVALLLAAAILLCVVLLRHTTICPLRKLAMAAAVFAKEDRPFTHVDVIDLNIRSNDESSDLYHEIRAMENRIVDYTEHLTRVTAEKERVGTELRMASQIQASMLPNIFPAFPNRDDFDLYASMTPAKEVGGDFYDFILIDDQHLAVLIADVSDKGVPAALFMMASKILINYRSQLGGSPSEILTAVNAQICKDNKTRMFVTVWMGILDLETGIMTCANGGHEYPVIRGQDGVFRLLKDKHGLVVGALTRSKYQDYEIRMMPGDAIFVYTDGVPEACNADGEFYGMERMTDVLNRIAAHDPRGILEGVQADVDAFTGDAKQFDDLTMLCLEYKGRQQGSAS